eukprot:767009-Hanusia_phi.AAC.13
MGISVGLSFSSSTFWLSETSLSCKVSAGSGHSKTFVITTSRTSSSSSEAFTFDHLEVVGLVSNHSNIFSRATLSVGISASYLSWSTSSRLGLTASEVTQWMSETEIRCKSFFSLGPCYAIVVTTSMCASSISEVLSFDISSLKTENDSSTNAATLNPSHALVIGQNFLAFSASPMVRVGRSSAETSTWLSSSALACRSSALVAATLKFTATVSQGVGTSTECFTSDRPTIVMQEASSEYCDYFRMAHCASLRIDCNGRNGQCACDSVFAGCLRGIGCTAHMMVFQALFAAGCNDGMIDPPHSHPALLSTAEPRKQDIFGSGIGIWKSSGVGRGGGTSCERTHWSSDSALSLSTSSGSGGSKLVALTSMRQVGTLTNAYGYEDGKLGVVNCSNLPIDACQVVIQARGVSLGLGSSMSIGSRLGRSSASATVWLSDSAMILRAVQGIGQYLMASVTSGMRVGTSVNQFSFDEIVHQFYLWNANLTVSGKNFGYFDSSIMFTFGYTASEETSWRSDSSIFCVIPYGIPDSSDVVATVLNQPATHSAGFSYQPPKLKTIFVRTSCSSVQNDSKCSEYPVAVGGGDLSMLGALLGRSSLSVATRSGGTACEASFWTSDTAVSCKLGEGMGVLIQSLVTVIQFQSTAQDAFNFSDPCVSSAKLTNGQPGGMQLITISGTNFGTVDYSYNVAMKHLGSSCKTFEWTSDSSVTCLTHPGLGEGIDLYFIQNHSVSNCNHFSSHFTYDAPEVLGISPSILPALAGDTYPKSAGNVKITGRNFGIYPPTSVEANVGGTYSFDVFWIADTSIVAVVQPGEFLPQVSTKYSVQVTLEGRSGVFLPNAVNFSIPTLTDVSIFSDSIAAGSQTILHVRFLSTTQIPGNATVEFSYSVEASFYVQQPYKATQVTGLDGNILLRTFTRRAFTDCAVLGWQMINEVSCTDSAICQSDLHGFCEDRSGIPCSGKRNYSEALSFCAKVGTRLCSREELSSFPLSYVSLCGYSSGDFIWTSTPSTINKDQAEFVIISRNELAGQVQSEISTSTDNAHFVQCCSDYITSQIVVLSREGYGSQVPVGALVEIGIPVRLPIKAGKQMRSSLRIKTANGASIAIGTEIPVAEVLPGPPDATLSTLIYLNDTYLASKSLRAGTNGNVKILTRDTYGNVRFVGLPSNVRFSASFIGQGVGSTMTSDSLDGILAVTYAATASGRYGLSIVFNDIPISGSPFQAMVVPNDVNVTVSSISYSAGFSIGAVGTARQVTVIARDRYGNLISTSTQIQFDLYVIRSLDSLQYLTTKLYPDNTTALFVTKSGVFFVSVYYNSQLISPISPLSLSPSFTEASQTLILDNYGGVITDIVSFSIQARDEYGNDRTLSTDTWDITILNTESKVTFLTKATPSPTKGGLYIVEFTAPDVKMNLTASVKLIGKEVAGSPFTLIIVDEAGPADAFRSKVIGFSTDSNLATRGTAGIPFSFTVQIRDSRGINRRSGGDDVSYSIGTGPKIRMNDLQNGKYNASTVRYSVGIYEIRVFLNQLSPMDKSPYNLTVVPAVPSGPASVVSGNDLLAITAGVRSTFEIQSFDAFGNAIKYPPDQTPHVITSQLTGPSIVSVNIFYQNFLHLASYVVTRSGTYLLHILLLSDGSKVGKSPYNITVFPNQPSSTSRLYSKTSSSTAGLPSTFAVDLKDTFGNNYISNSPYVVRINIRRICTAEPCNPNLLLVAQQNVLAPYTYEVGVIFTISGNYLINSTLGGLNVVGSPLSFATLPSSIDITKTLFSTTFSDFNIVQLGDRSNIVIVTRDKFSNNLTDGGQSYSAGVISSPTTILITFNFQDFVNGTYVISWKPTDKGQYNLQLYWGQTALNGNLQFYVIPAATDPNLCVIQPAIPFFFVAGQTTTFSIQARDGSGSNKPDLFAFSKGWEKTELFMIAQYDSVGMMMKNRTCLFGSTTYDCAFVFLIAGSYTLKVVYGPQMANLPGSPRIIKVSPGPIVAQGCTYQALTVATAGLMQNFFIQTRDLYGNLGEYDPFSNSIRFSIKVMNSFNIEISCYSARGCMLNNLNGTFSAQTLLTQTGRYTVMIQLSGNNIRGSPAEFAVTSSIVDLSRCTVQTYALSGSVLPLSLATAGNVQNMLIFLRDGYGNLAAENSVLDLSISKKPAFIGDQQTVINYSPTYQVAAKAWQVISSITRSGDWSLKVNVIINAASLPISGSPFSIQMLPDAVYAPNCYAEGTGLSSTARTQTSIISIVQSDRYGNVITDDYSRFTWTINQGQGSDAIFQGNGIYTFGYVLSNLGSYQLSIVLTETCVSPDSCIPDGRGIFKSPFSVVCISNVGPVSPLESTIVGTSYMFRSTDSVEPILVQTRDRSGLLLLGGDVQIQKVSVKVRVSSNDIAVVDNKDGTFSFVPQLPTAGVYTVWVQVSSLTTTAHISNSPFNLRILPGATATSTTTVDWTRKSIFTGVLQDFRVFARDASQNFQVYGGAGREGDLFSLYVNDTLCDSTNAPTCKLASGAVQLATTNATFAAHYKLSVTLREVRIGSAHVIEVVPGLVDFRMCTSTGLGLTGSVAGDAATFSTLARDSFGNPTRQFQDTKLVTKLQLMIQANYSFTYVPFLVTSGWNTQWLLTTAGSYWMDVGGFQNSSFIHSQGSPFSVVVNPSLPDASLTIAYGTSLSHGRAGVATTFTVQSKDSFGNNLTSGGLFFNVLIGGPPFLFANVEDLYNPSSAAVAPQYNGQYVVSYMTTVSADFYKVSIRRSGIHIFGSPYSLRVIGGITCAIRSELRGSALSVATAGIPSSFWILTRDEFNNNVVDSTDVFVVSFNPDYARDSNEAAIAPWVNASEGFCSRTTIPCTSETVTKLCPDACSRMLGYIFTKSGFYSLIVSVNRVPINFVAQQLITNAAIFNATNTLLTVGGQPVATLKSMMVGDSISLQINVRDGYYNLVPTYALVTASVSYTATDAQNQGSFTIPCTVARSGIYRGVLAPTVSGDYKLMISVNAMSTQPHSFIVQNGVIAAFACTLEVPNSIATAGIKGSFSVLAKDAYGNRVRTINTDTFSASLLTMLSDSNQVQVVITTPAVSNGIFYAEYYVTRAAAYTIRVTSSGLQVETGRQISVVPNSPVSAYASGLGLNGAPVGVTSSFDIFSTDSFGNIRAGAAVEDLVNHEVVVFSPSVVVSEQLLIQDSRQIFFYKADQAVQFSLNIFRDGKTLNSYNISVFFSLGPPDPSQFDIISTASSYDPFTQSLDVYGTVGLQTFSVQIRNKAGVVIPFKNVAYVKNFSISLQGPIATNTTIIETCPGSVCTDRGGLFQISFDAPMSALYLINILFEQSLIRNYRAVRVQVVPGIPFPANCYAQGTGLKEGVAGIESSISLYSFDKFKNQIVYGELVNFGEYSISFQVCSLTSNCPIQSKVVSSITAPKITYLTTTAANYTFTIKLMNEIGTPVDIAGAPFTTSIAPSSVVVHTSSFQMIGGSIATAGQESSFMVILRDKYGNVNQIEAVEINVQAVGPETAESNFLLNSAVGDNFFTVNLYVIGQYQVTVGRVSVDRIVEELQSSPMLVTVLSGTANALKSVSAGVGTSTAVALTNSTFCLAVKDSYGNPKTLSSAEAAALLSSTLNGKSTSPEYPSVTCFYEWLTASLPADFWCLNFFCDVPGLAELKIYLDGNQTLGSPFEVTVLKRTAPIITEVRFSTSGVKLTALFDQSTNKANMVGVVSCVYLLSDVTLAMLGDNPTCFWPADDSFEIFLGPGSNVVIGNMIELRSGRVRDAANVAYYSNGGARVQLPYVPPQPAIVVRSAKMYGMCEDIVLDASTSYGGAGRKMTFLWGVRPGIPNEEAVTSYLTQIGSVANCTVANSLLSPGTSYTFVLRVTNFLEQFSEQEIPVVVSQYPLPKVYIIGSSVRTVTREKGFSLEGYSALPLCNSSAVTANTSSDTTIVFEWRIVSDAKFPLDSATVLSRKLWVDNSFLIVGATYIFTLRGTMSKTPQMYGEQNVTLFIAGQPIQAKLRAKNMITSGESLVLDASYSYDPDFTPDAWSFQWACTEVSSLLPYCFDDKDGIIYGDTPLLTIPAGNLQVGYTYRFTVLAIKEPGPRTSSTYVAVMVIAPDSQVRRRLLTTPLNLEWSSSLEVFVDGISARKQNVKERLKLSGSIFPLGTSDIAKFAWQIVDGDKSDTYEVLSKDDSAYFVLEKNSLIPGSVYKVRLEGWIEGGDFFSFTEYIFQTNGAPSAGSIEISPTTGVALSQDFEGTCSNWVDDREDEPLSYTWLLHSSNGSRLLGRRSLSNVMNLRLPPSDRDDGLLFLSARICDVFDACTDTPEIFVQVFSNESSLPSVQDSVQAVELGLGVGDETKVLQTIVGIGTTTNLQPSYRRRLLQSDSNLRTTLTGAIDSVLSVAKIDSELLDTASDGLQSATGINSVGQASDRADTRSLVTNLLTGSSQVGGGSDNTLLNLNKVIEQSLTESLKSSDSVSNETADIAAQLASLTDVALLGFVPGQKARKIDGPIPSTVSRLANDGSATRGLNVSTTGGYFKLPDESIQSSSKSIGLDLKILEFSPGSNIHALDQPNTSAEAISGITSFEIKGVSVVTQQPIEFMIPLTKPTLQGQSENLSLTNVSNATSVVERCTFWDAIKKDWSSRGCAVSSLDIHGIKCECFHLTDFTSSQSAPAPDVNMVDPIGGASALLAAKGSQLTVIIFMAAILVVYIGAVLLSRYFDEKHLKEFLKSPAHFIRDRDRAVRDSKYMLVNELIKMFEAKHHLAHVMNAKPYSPLSRTQMLTCFFCYIASSMTANAIFYGKDPSTPADALIKGVLSSLITVTIRTSRVFHN